MIKLVLDNPRNETEEFMFIEIKSKDGELSWINETLWSETFETKEAADKWLEHTLGNCKIPSNPEINKG